MAAGLEALAVGLTKRVLQQLPDLGRRRQPAVRKDGRSPACRLCRNEDPVDDRVRRLEDGDRAELEFARSSLHGARNAPEAESEALDFHALLPQLLGSVCDLGGRWEGRVRREK